MLNLIHEGRIGCFQPVTYLSRIDLTVLRPMVYISEREVKSSVRRTEIPVITNPCPADGYTQREEMKKLIKNMDTEYKGFKVRLFGALKRSGLDGWGTENLYEEDNDDE